jgi:phosphate-selective porin
MRAAAFCCAIVLAFGLRAPAQDRPAQTPPASSSSEAQHPDTDYAPQVRTVPDRIPATGFVMPDVPDEWNNRTAYENRLFSTRLSIVPLVDYTAFVQDDNSKEQVGDQDSQWDLRTFRIMFRGQVKTAHPITYLISVEVKGKDHITNEGDSAFGFTDFEIGTPLGKYGSIKFGKIKEPFAYELVGDAANLQQAERILSPFFVSRGIGLRWTASMAHDRMTASAGWFNDWWIENVSFKTSGNDFAGRLTALPSSSDDGSNYVAVGVSTRHIGPDQGAVRFRGRPESNTASYYVDSGDIPAARAGELGLEFLLGRGPVFLTTECARAWVGSPETINPQFWGAYATLSYVLTGEHRPYDRKVGYARRILPAGRWGAWEIFGRYSHVDIDDRLVRGGLMDKGTLGINWWATRRWKIGFDYGLTDLDRNGVNGITRAFHTRMQWAY